MRGNYALMLGTRVACSLVRFSARAVPEFIDPVFAKTSPKRSFRMTENERIGLVFVKTGSINSGTGVHGANMR